MDKNQMAVAVFDKYASEYQDKFMALPNYEDTFDLFCNNIPQTNARIFEIACGPGNITRYLLNKRPDFQLLGIDLAPAMVELAKANNPEAEFRCMDCRKIDTIREKYDGILCGFALPYLDKEEAAQLIRNAATLLHPKGILYLSTMENDYSTSGLKTSSKGDSVYMYYYKATDLIGMLEENGFTALHEIRKDYPETDGSVTVDLVVVARKGDLN